MFSPNVDSQSPLFEDSHVLNFRLDVNEETKGGDGTDVAARIVKVFQSLTEYSLTVINIVTSVDVEHNKFTISDKSHLQIIELLLANCEFKLIIFLPILEYKYLEKIRELRNKAVMIILAPMMPRFPSTEIITAIGESERHVRFKVADIVFPIEDEQLSKSETEMAGAAVAVAFAAAILHIDGSERTGK